MGSSLRGLRARRLPLSGTVTPDVVVALGNRPDALTFRHQSRILVGIGRAATLSLPGGSGDGPGLRTAAADLAAVPTEDALGIGADGGPAGPPPHPLVAFGALPFVPGSPGALVVPALLLGIEPDGRSWVSVVVPDGEELPTEGEAAAALLAFPPAPRTPAPAGTALGADTDRDSFVQAIATALEAIAAGRVRKVVLGRSAHLDLPRPLPVGELVHRWGGLEPACTTFALPVELDGRSATMAGASPELLVARHGTTLVTRPLAGTTGHDGGRDRPVAGGVPLTRSPKDGLEHRLVVDAIADTLRPLCRDLAVPDRPGLHHLRSITHLATEMTGELRPGPEGVPSALELAGLLHPTPAVGGVPTDPALKLIAALDSRPRGTFAGPVGYVDGAGDGTWVVGIRSLVCGHGGEGPDPIRLWAGVGIVDGSDATAEWAETDLKLAAVVDAVRAVTGTPLHVEPGSGDGAEPAADPAVA